MFTPLRILLLLVVAYIMLKNMKKEKFEDKLESTPKSLKILIIITVSGIVLSVGLILYNYLKDRHLDRIASYVS